MPLQFQPTPYRPPEREPSFQEKYIEPALRAVSVFNQTRQTNDARKYQELQVQMAKAKEAREAAQHSYEYGDPTANPVTPGGFTQADPRMNLYQPATAGAETQFGNITQGGQPDMMAGPRAAAPATPLQPGGGLMERFRSWQESRRAGGVPQGSEMSDEQMWSPTVGSKRRTELRNL